VRDRIISGCQPQERVPIDDRLAVIGILDGLCNLSDIRLEALMCHIQEVGGQRMGYRFKMVPGARIRCEGVHRDINVAECRRHAFRAKPGNRDDDDDVRFWRHCVDTADIPKELELAARQAHEALDGVPLCDASKLITKARATSAEQPPAINSAPEAAPDPRKIIEFLELEARRVLPPTTSPLSVPVPQLAREHAREHKYDTTAILEGLEERDAVGRAKYGQSLHTHDGRDSGRDAWEEVLDLVQYLVKWKHEVGASLGYCRDNTIAYAVGEALALADRIAWLREVEKSNAKKAEGSQ
jgi:hypothetical protein